MRAPAHCWSVVAEVLESTKELGETAGPVCVGLVSGGRGCLVGKVLDVQALRP